jgi:hypothetical protein
MNNQKAAILVGFKDNHPVFVPVGTTNDAFPVETVTYKLSLVYHLSPVWNNIMELFKNI